MDGPGGIARGLRRLAALAAAASAAACGPAPERPDRPVVAVSVAPQAFLVARIAGERVRVVALIPPGTSPASFQPGVGELRAVEEASLYVKVGHPHFPFERAWLDALLSDRGDLRVFDSSQGLAATAGDPHVWLAPSQGRRIAEGVAAALVELLPEHRRELEANLARLQQEIDAVDREIRGRLAGLAGRSFFVLHPAWGHFAREYGLRQVALERDHKQPDARELAELIRLARELGVAVVFVQPQFDRAAAEVFAAEVGARVAVLDPLAYEWSDNLRRVARSVAEALRE